MTSVALDCAAAEENKPWAIRSVTSTAREEIAEINTPTCRRNFMPRPLSQQKLYSLSGISLQRKKQFLQLRRIVCFFFALVAGCTAA